MKIIKALKLKRPENDLCINGWIFGFDTQKT